MRTLFRSNFFEDFQLGRVFDHATPRTLTEADQSLYIALTGSRTPLSSAATIAERAGFSRRPLEDLLIFNTAFGKTVPDISLNAVANLGYAETRFLAPVYSGDTISVRSEVIGLMETSNRKAGVVYVRSDARNQHDRTVLTWVRWVMVHKRDAASPMPAAVIPDLQSSVSASEIAKDMLPKHAQPIFDATGSQAEWADFLPGTRIDHPCGMTINDSDHSSATRLYQNTARGHFDARLMAQSAQGGRLVYGGHVISLCRSLSYDGLENAFCLMAINGGRHVAPAFAGDTIYCTTMVLEQMDIGNAEFGALRLRTIGAKNIERAEDIAYPSQNMPGQYSQNTILDLDYTVAFPRKKNH